MYLAAGEPEQSTTGHVRMVHVRGMMPHLPDTYPIQFCQDAPIALQTVKVLHGDLNELSVESFQPDSQWLIWPSKSQGN